MKKGKAHMFLILLSVVISLSNCTMQERKYRKGFHVEWNNKKAINNNVASLDAPSLIQLPVKTKKEAQPLATEVYASSNNERAKPSKSLKPIFIKVVNDTCGDMLVMIDGTVIQAKIIEISETVIKYKKCNNIDGPLYTAKLENVSRIEYMNGKKEIINHTSLPNSNQANTVKPYQNTKQVKEGYNQMAIASLVMGILSFTMLLAILTGPLAFIFGLMAKKQLNEGKGSRGKGMAIFGIVVGAIVLSILLLLIIALVI